MLAMPNAFYKNPEGNALQMLRQQILVETERNIQQSLMELFALRSFLSQGQICLCIPLQGFSMGTAFSPQLNFLPPHMPELPQPAKKTPGEPTVTKDTKLTVTLKNDRERKNVVQSKSDEYRLRSDSVEVVIDLRGVLPAEVSVRVEEKCIRVEVNRVDKDGHKNYWRQYDLPACVHAESAKCLLSHDGFLHISVPWYRMEQ